MPSFALKAVSAAVLSLATFAATAADASCPNCFAKRWVYFQGNLAKPEHLAAIKRLVDDAKANGFNGIAIASGGYGAYTQLIVNPTSQYMTDLGKNLQVAVAYAAEKKIELIPVGGGPEVPAARYPELTEALPASATYKVANGFASIVPTAIATEGTFDVKGSWEMDVGPDKNNPYVSIDPSEGHMDERTDTRSSVKLVPASVAWTGDQAGWLNSRLMREFKLSANKGYRLSFWVKASAGYATDKLFIQLIPTGSDQPIYRNGGLGWGTQPNGEWNEAGNSEKGMFDAGQDWKRYELDFNTGDKSAIRMYMGTQSVGVAGTAVWVDDLQVTELGLAHPIRRATTPIVVTPAAGGAAYVEGTDYAIDTTDKTRLAILRNSTIPADATLSVSWYQSGVNMLGRWNTAATTCTADGKYFSAQKALYDKLYGYFGEKFSAETTAKYFMYYDEIRLMNWDPACKSTTAGEYLRNMVNGVNTRLTNVKDNGYAKPLEVLVWNDMFDLSMNAKARYYHVKGDLSKWMTPLAKSIVIVNWAGGGGTGTTDDDVRKASLDQFAGEGHKQVVALYYDNLASVTNWANVMNAAPNVPVDGVMYTTWKAIDDKTPYSVPYGNLANVAKQMRASFKGRWPE